LGEFHAKNGYKYGKYREALVFIRENGHRSFVAIADGWTGACGKYPRRADKEGNDACRSGAPAGRRRTSARK
jgi:hypothetical protein